VVEVGIGRRTAVARSLADTGVDVTATDIREREVPPVVTFVRDDVTAPNRAVYDGAELLYALNLPPELHRPLARLARAVDAKCWFTTLGGDQPVVPVERVALPDETLYLVSGSQGF
jgi:uncharacterized UPF0146 family protein